MTKTPTTEEMLQSFLAVLPPSIETDRDTAKRAVRALLRVAAAIEVNIPYPEHAFVMQAVKEFRQAESLLTAAKQGAEQKQVLDAVFDITAKAVGK